MSLVMKGLKEYIAKHGRHFTEELAHKVVIVDWSFEEMESIAQSKVYYNVTGSTIGDMMYLADIVHEAYPKEYSRKDHCVDYALAVIGDVDYTGHAFYLWTQVAEDFNLTPYI